MDIVLLTIFPDIFRSYLQESILKRAIEKKLIRVRVVNIRDFTLDKHKKVDDRPYGGGPGMVMQVEPIARALKKVVGKKNASTKVILTSAKGKIFDQAKAHSLAKFKKIVIICGHYEGVDERVMRFVDEELSVGEYVLTGGELPALTIVDAVARLLPGVLGDSESHKDESHEQKKMLEYPQYTRPENFRGQTVPKILLSGNHKDIAEWRTKHKKKL